MSSIIKKITPGFVIQTYDTDLDVYTGQEFIAGDDSQIDYEDENGETLSRSVLEINQGHDDGVWVEPPLLLEMVQPQQPTAYQQVVSELAIDCEGAEDLLELAIDAMRNEIKEAAGIM